MYSTQYTARALWGVHKWMCSTGRKKTSTGAQQNRSCVTTQFRGGSGTYRKELNFKKRASLRAVLLNLTSKTNSYKTWTWKIIVLEF